MNTTRRSFLATCLGALGLGSWLARFVPKERLLIIADESAPVFGLIASPEATAVLSQAYLDAAYEAIVMVGGRIAGPICFRKPEVDLDAPRYNFVNGVYVQVPKYESKT